MLKTAVIIPLMLFLFIFSCASVDKKPNSLKLNEKELTKKVHKLLAEFDNTNSPGAAIGVVKDGKLIYVKGYGMASLENSVPITPDTKFKLASVSKQFTAACIALLIEEKKVNYNDDIKKFFPEMPNYGHSIKVSHLIHHTSGLMDFYSLLSYKGHKIEDYSNIKYFYDLVFNYKKLNFTPGEKYKYSNSNYILLAEIIKKVTGKSFAQYAKEKLFTLLGMNDTLVDDKYQQVIKNMSRSYYPVGDGKFNKMIHQTDTTGDGGVVSTVKDLHLWVNALNNQKIGGKRFHTLMHTRGKTNDGKELDYAFGLGISEYKGRKQVSHSGGWLGYRTFLLNFPDDKISIIYLSNRTDGRLKKISFKIADIFLKPNRQNHDKSSTKPSTITPEKLSKKELEQFTGVYFYEQEKYAREIYLKNDRLFYKRTDSDETEMIPIDKNIFTFENSPDIRITFTKSTEDNQLQMSFKESSKKSPMKAIRFDTFKQHTPDDLKDYLGIYYFSNNNFYRSFSIKDNKVMWGFSTKNHTKLKQISKNFYSWNGNYNILFRLLKSDNGKLKIEVFENKTSYFADKMTLEKVKSNFSNQLLGSYFSKEFNLVVQILKNNSGNLIFKINSRTFSNLKIINKELSIVEDSYNHSVKFLYNENSEVEALYYKFRNITPKFIKQK